MTSKNFKSLGGKHIEHFIKSHPKRCKVNMKKAKMDSQLMAELANFRKIFNCSPVWTRERQDFGLGPIYEEQPDSFVLGDNSSDPWDATTNPDGIVPVVVHPQLVKGQGDNEPKPLSQEQIDGIKFLWDCVEHDQGGILAHDMGLGKSRTGVTLISTLLQQSPNSKGKSTAGIKKCIIIAPKSGVDIWDHEFAKWTPTEIPVKVEVLKTGNKKGWEVVDKFILPTSPSNVLILSYETFLKYNSSFVNTGFQSYGVNSVDLVICDEAHVLKNDQTRRVKNLKTFQACKLWLGFTGTPFQNNIEELCILVNFFHRGGPLATAIGRKKYCQPIIFELKKHNTLVTNHAKKLLAELRRIIRSGMHFRLNDFNIERHEMTICVPLHGHPNYYGASGPKFLQHTLYKTLTEVLKESEIIFFEKLSYLHKACIHPQELRKAMDKHPLVFASLIELYDTYFPKEGMEENLKLFVPMYSAKINIVALMAKHLKDTLPKEKMIIVSNSTVLLNMVKTFFDDIFKINVIVYDGKTSEAERQRRIHTFESEDNTQILLLSLKAGGTALTLTRANHLVLMDPDYNPANDRQALGRIYRPTQKRPVYIYRLLATGTLEEDKFIHQLRKQDMEKYFRTEGRTQTYFKHEDLLVYQDETRSYIRDLLDNVDIKNFNSEESDSMDRIFAEEMQSAKRYQESYEIPENLALVKSIENLISYVFHIDKIPDPAETLVLATENNEDINITVED